MSSRNPVSSKACTGHSDQRSKSRSAPTPDTIAGQLRQRLLALEYPAFARCLCVLLEVLGYEEVQPAGRQEWKGYNRPGGGGYDLEAVLPGGLAPRRAVAQIKQFDGLNVHQRSVDELRGACLRCGAAEAILVTTSSFSQVVLQHAEDLGASGTQVAPVRLIDGKELLGLLIRHRLGVRERLQGGNRRLAVDEVFFANLRLPAVQGDQNVAAKLLQSSQKPPTNEQPDTKPGWKLTIYLSGNSGSANVKATKGGR